ncbi:hypothetical protein DSO57_1026271 [Entomophthora muscae]|uniref:Uncharacterized protein n=1 Tax=Entomophthora muscae TaxID=34485 RepID=A0ACC2RTA6_9FUNG|nr:hypothetical protein DSO57_1026271 [Entomophthora muscae]
MITFTSSWEVPFSRNQSELKTGCIKLYNSQEYFFGCLEKTRHGFFWGSKEKVSNSISCPASTVCEVHQTRPYLVSWKHNSTLTLSHEDLMVLAAPPIKSRHLASMPTELDTLEKMSFSGPGTAHMVVYPLMWRSQGLFKYTRGKDGQTYRHRQQITIDFPVIDNRHEIFGRLALDR